jgi:hypothetical protein
MSAIHLLIPATVLLVSAEAHGDGASLGGEHGRLPAALNVAREPPFPVCWWDPREEPGAPWAEWYERRYGAKAPPRVLRALQRTEAVFQKYSTSLGLPSTSAHGQIAPMFRGPHNAWENLRSNVELLDSTAPRRARLGRQPMAPDDELIARVLEEKEQAIRLAEASLVDLERARASMAEAHYAELRLYLALGADCAALWRQIGEAFFRGLQLRQSGKLESSAVARLATVCNELLAQAYALEGKYGIECWPIFPRGRGTTAYECVVGMYADFVDLLRGTEPRPLGGPEPEARPETSVELLWRAVLGVGRGAGEQEVNVALDDGLRTCDFTPSGLALTGTGGRLLLPTGRTTRGPQLRAGQEYRLVIRADAGGITVAAE